MELKEGQKALNFKAPNQNGDLKELKDYSDKWLVLYFYPKDFTPGCIIEACNFRDGHNELKKLASVVGVSKDTVEKHKKFKERFTLPFELLSDKDGKMTSDYGADGVVFKKRITFLIDPRGIINKIYKTVKPTEHTQEVVKDLKELK